MGSHAEPNLPQLLGPAVEQAPVVHNIPESVVNDCRDLASSVKDWCELGPAPASLTLQDTYKELLELDDFHQKVIELAEASVSAHRATVPSTGNTASGSASGPSFSGIAGLPMDMPGAPGLHDPATAYRMLSAKPKNPLDMVLTWDENDQSVLTHGMRPGTSLRKLLAAGFDQRRQALRARANDLSRPKIRRLKLADLPLEILHLIFGNLQERAVGKFGRAVDWASYSASKGPERRRAVRNARLVSRLFCELATPLMFPVIRLQISLSSLELVDKISRCPRIAAGVRGIQLSLGYRPKDLATNLVRFGDTRIADLRALESACYVEKNQLDMLGQAGFDQQRAAALEQAVLNMSNLDATWGECIETIRWMPAPVNVPQPTSEYQEILLSAHREFARLHNEQDRLLRDGAFVKTLVSAMRRMGGVRSLRFTDRMDAQRLGDDIPNDYIVPLTNMRVLTRLLVAPITWAVMENDPSGSAELAPARLLWQLPIALHDAGVPLTELKIDVIPIYRGAPLLCPTEAATSTTPTTATNTNNTNSNQPTTPWHKLTAACASLDSFEFVGRNIVSFGYDKMRAQDRPILGRFVSAVLAGCAPCTLRSLALEFIPWGVNALPTPGHDQQGFFRASDLVGVLPASMPRLRELRVAGVEVTQPALEALCNWPVRGTFEALAFASVWLRGGGDGNGDDGDDDGARWADAVDILRAKLDAAGARARNSKKPSLHLEVLRGGEFGDLETPPMLEALWTHHAGAPAAPAPAGAGENGGENGGDGQETWEAAWPTEEEVAESNGAWRRVLAAPRRVCRTAEYIMGERGENPLREGAEADELLEGLAEQAHMLNCAMS